MKKIFENKVAIVTGGSFGIGRAACIAFAKRGAKVCIDFYSKMAGSDIQFYTY